MRSGQIGANYCEADDVVFENDFEQYLGLRKNEARKTKSLASYDRTELSRHEERMHDALQWQEAKELH